VIVDRGRRQPVGDEAALPGEHIPAQRGGHPVMTIALFGEGDEAIQMQGDFLGDRGGADPDDGEREKARRPRGEGVGNIVRMPARQRLHLSGSELREMGAGGEGFNGVIMA